jgi:hypothetical protein
VPHERATKDERIQIVRARNRDVEKVNLIVKQSRKRATERELAGNPLLSPEREATRPARAIPNTNDDDFLSFLEQNYPDQEGPL